MERMDREVLKIMLVDDEPIMLTKLKTLMNYRQLGFEICGEFSSGKAAAAALDSLQPDVLFTDMRMPAMDGVELITYLKQSYPHIKVITISGYEDFQYVYQSLQNGALDYLLKHQLDSERMKAVLNKIRMQRIEEQDVIRKESAIHSKVARADKIVRSDDLRRYLSGQESQMEGQSMTFPDHFRPFYMLLLEMDEWEGAGKADGILEDMIEKIFSETGQCMTIHLGRGRYLAFHRMDKTSSEQSHQEILHQSLVRCQNSAKRFLNKSLSCCRSGLLSDTGKIKAQYGLLAGALDAKFYLGLGKILPVSDAPKIARPFVFPEHAMDSKNQLQTLRSAIQDYGSYSKEKLISSDILKGHCKHMADWLQKEGEKWGITKQDLPIPDFASANDYQELMAFVAEWLHAFEAAMPFFSKTKGHSPNVANALKFIHENYINPISLDTVAHVVGLNDAYLSRLFKEETGSGMMEYLKELRMQKAKYLLENSSYRIKEICLMCGFHDYGYFIRSFKAVTGMSPVKYRQKL